MSAITTHVLDTSLGRPAAGVGVRLDLVSGGAVREIGAGATDGDGRIRDLGPDQIEPGTYRLTFDTAGYAASSGQDCFFPEVTIAFAITDPATHHHVPLLLSPFAYSTYRGS